MEFKVMSFNIKRDFGIEKKERTWNYRKSKVCKLIEESQCDIIGLQEVLPHMKEDLETNLIDFQLLGKGRYHNIKPEQDEHTNILVKNQPFEVVENHTFWLSRTPNKIASRFYTAAFPRICTLATLRINDQKIRVLNTHLDHLSPFARNASISLILEIIEELDQHSNLPTILMGDFNTSQNSRVIKKLRTKMQDVFLHDEVYVTNTFHNYSGKQNPKRSPIDFIFVSHHFSINSTYIVNEPIDGIYPSDHFPIITSLTLKTTI